MNKYVAIPVLIVVSASLGRGLLTPGSLPAAQHGTFRASNMDALREDVLAFANTARFDASEMQAYRDPGGPLELSIDNLRCNGVVVASLMWHPSDVGFSGSYLLYRLPFVDSLEYEHFESAFLELLNTHADVSNVGTSDELSDFYKWRLRMTWDVSSTCRFPMPLVDLIPGRG